MSVAYIVKRMDKNNELKCVVTKGESDYHLHVTSGFFELEYTFDYEDEIYDCLYNDFRLHVFKLYRFKVLNAEEVSTYLDEMHWFAYEISELDL